MKSLSITILLSISIIFSQAQTGTISGKITQADSITVISGANVLIEKMNLGTTTNGNGNYSIKNVPIGNHILAISTIGYQTLRSEIIVKANETVIADFNITESLLKLGEVLIMANGSIGLKDIPGSVQYISSKELQKFSYTDINRTLRAVPGINIQEEDGFGLRPNIGLRGTGVERSSKITSMEDGVLMAPAPYAEPAAYYFPTIGRMQGIEILKGSSQIKYGPFTTGGAINLISTQIPTQFSGRFNLLGGSFGSRNLHAFVGNSHKNFGYIAETFQYGSDGFKQLDGGGNTGFDKKDYLVKFRLNTNPNAKIYQSVTFKIGETNETSNETYLGVTETDFKANPYRRYFASQKDLMKTDQSQFSITHLIKVSKKVSIITTAYRSDFKRNWYKLDKVKDSTGKSTSIADLLQNPANFNDAFAILAGSTSTNQNALFVRANNRSYSAQGIQSAISYNFKTRGIAHDINLGLRLHKDYVDRFQWDDEYFMNNGVMQLTKTGTPGSESNRIKSANAFASFLQYKIKYKKFTAIPGIRYENIKLLEKDYGKNDPQRTEVNLKKNENRVEVFIPGIGFDYQHSRFLSFFAGVHKGFSPPGANNETVPEKSVNYELGTRYTKGAISGQAVVFLNDYSNLLGSDLAASGGGGTGDLFNAGAVKAKGLEFQMTYDLMAFNNHSHFNLPLSIVYTYTDAVFKNAFISTFEDWGKVAAGDQFPYMAHNQFTFILGLEYKKFSINMSGRYMDEMRTSPGQGDIPNNGKTDSYLVIDANASYVMHKNVSLFVSCNNLTNEVYVVARRPSGLRPGMPRVFNIGLKSNF
ncbi:MAG: TonB-dependent receptor domain-containing protein [Bacteroidia bacterium]